MQKTTVTSAILSAENALRSLQAKARYIFSSTEFAALTGREAGGPAVNAALQRLARTGRIALVSKRPAAWLIIPPEQEHYGAPPVDWWLDDYLKISDPHYYVALLSAARQWGSGHYARQTIQVMVSSRRSSLTVGKLGIEFLFKQNLAQTPVVRKTGSVASLRVSTREATVLDLIRHQSTIGGLESIVRVVKDFLPELTQQGLRDALNALDQAPAAQRLGFILDYFDKRLAACVWTWLNDKRINPQPLETGMPETVGPISMHGKWGVQYIQQQEQLIKELA